MDLNHLRDAWDKWGAVDPMWAALTAPDKANQRWSTDAFFLTGEHEIADLLEYVKRLGIELRFGSALDFGCGVGRLSRALSKHFETVIGVDIAPSMLAQAREFSLAGRRVEYVLNQEDNLRVFKDASFDFVYSNLTLQHMPPRFSRTYLAEFARVLKRGGCLIFQLPSERRRQRVAWKRLVREVVPTGIIDGLIRWKVRRMAAKRRLPVMEMYAVRTRSVVDLLESRGLHVVAAEERAEESSVWLSCWYFATKLS
jgi:ubiquinone/menaquinone biosynthesis C-methylase UbiE